MMTTTDTVEIVMSRHADVRRHSTWIATIPRSYLADPQYVTAGGEPTDVLERLIRANGDEFDVNYDDVDYDVAWDIVSPADLRAAAVDLSAKYPHTTELQRRIVTKYSEHFNNTGGNDPLDLLERLATEKRLLTTNMPVAILAMAVSSQVTLLATLERAEVIGNA